MNNGQKRRGAPPGNQRALKHGRRSYAAEMNRKADSAILKLAAHLLVKCDGLSVRCRPSPLRPDQIALIAARYPGALEMAAACGVVALSTPSAA